VTVTVSYFRYTESKTKEFFLFNFTTKCGKYCFDF